MKVKHIQKHFSIIEEKERKIENNRNNFHNKICMYVKCLKRKEKTNFCNKICKIMKIKEITFAIKYVCEIFENKIKTIL